MKSQRYLADILSDGFLKENIMTAIEVPGFGREFAIKARTCPNRRFVFQRSLHPAAMEVLPQTYGADPAAIVARMVGCPSGEIMSPNLWVTDVLAEYSDLSIGENAVNFLQVHDVAELSIMHHFNDNGEPAKAVKALQFLPVLYDYLFPGSQYFVRDFRFLGTHGGGIRVYGPHSLLKIHPQMEDLSYTGLDEFHAQPFSDRLKGETGLRISFNYGRTPVELKPGSKCLFNVLGLNMPAANDPNGGVVILDFMRIFEDGAIPVQRLEVPYEFLTANPL